MWSFLLASLASANIHNSRELSHLGSNIGKSRQKTRVKQQGQTA
jgi:hypothetical protein